MNERTPTRQSTKQSSERGEWSEQSGERITKTKKKKEKKKQTASVTEGQHRCVWCVGQ